MQHYNYYYANDIFYMFTFLKLQFEG